VSLSSNPSHISCDSANMTDDLRQLGVEVRDFVQTKVGVTDFSRVWENLRRHTTEKREDRRQAKNQLVNFYTPPICLLGMLM